MIPPPLTMPSLVQQVIVAVASPPTDLVIQLPQHIEKLIRNVGREEELGLHPN